MSGRKLRQPVGKGRTHRSLLVPDEQINVSYLGLFANESLSY
jgi:hypothetical protein